MKICLVSPPLLKTPPDGYGGLERVVYDLGCALVSEGHDVTLIAPKGSRLEGGSVIETIESCGTTDVNWVQKEMDAFNIYSDRLLDGFDIIHDHSWFGFPYFARISDMGKDLKICHTHHGHLDWDKSKIPPQLGSINLIGISKFMQDAYKSRGWESKYVYNGIDTSHYTPRLERDGDEKRLVYVGRITKFKMPHAAIKAAIDLNIPIDIVGGTFVEDVNYLNSIKSECENSGGLASLHLDATDEEKIRIVSHSSASLVPSKFGEPYGLVATESLACGTPVIAYNDGALKEIINNPKVGTICDTYDDFVNAIKNIDGAKYDSSQCVARADYFSREKMASRYLKVYEDILKGSVW